MGRRVKMYYVHGRGSNQIPAYGWDGPKVLIEQPLVCSVIIETNGLNHIRGRLSRWRRVENSTAAQGLPGVLTSLLNAAASSLLYYAVYASGRSGPEGRPSSGPRTPRYPERRDLSSPMRVLTIRFKAGIQALA